MHIVVCLKPAPDVTLALEPEPGSSRLDPRSLSWRMNPAERLALAEALRWRAKAGGRVSLLCQGQGQAARDLLGQGLLAGADQAILGGGPADQLEEAPHLVPWLEARIRELAPDLVLCGDESGDRQRGEVGPGLARALGWPLAGGVGRVEALLEGQNRLRVWCALGRGQERLSELPLPAVLTFHDPGPGGEAGLELPAPLAPALRDRLGRQLHQVPEGDSADSPGLRPSYILALARRPQAPLAGPEAQASPAERMATVFQAGQSRRAGATLPADPAEAAEMLLAALRQRGIWPQA